MIARQTSTMRKIGSLTVAPDAEVYAETPRKTPSEISDALSLIAESLSVLRKELEYLEMEAGDYGSSKAPEEFPDVAQSRLYILGTHLDATRDAVSFLHECIL